jgi:Domain of unknown function (DUF5600)
MTIFSMRCMHNAVFVYAQVHACLLDHLHNQMPWLYGHEAQQAYLLEHLEASFEAVKRIYGFADGDMPSVELYRYAVFIVINSVTTWYILSDTTSPHSAQCDVVRHTCA